MKIFLYWEFNIFMIEKNTAIEMAVFPFINSYYTAVNLAAFSSLNVSVVMSHTLDGPKY